MNGTVLALLALGYLLYRHYGSTDLGGSLAKTATGGTTALPTSADIAKAQADLLAQTKAGLYGPQGSSTLIGPALDLRNSLVACWLGTAFSPPKGWDVNANPLLTIDQWDALNQACNDPSAKPVGGSQSLTADDYVKLRITKTGGLAGLAFYSPHYAGGVGETRPAPVLDMYRQGPSKWTM